MMSAITFLTVQQRRGQDVEATSTGIHIYLFVSVSVNLNQTRSNRLKNTLDLMSVPPWPQNSNGDLN